MLGSRQLWTVLALAAATACARVPPDAMLPRSGTSLYDVVVAAASGERTVTSVYLLEVVPGAERVWTIRTVHTEGTWEETGGAFAFDSGDPRPEDPWPLLLQHAVASVPAVVQFTDDGVPVGLEEEEGWRMASLKAMQALDLPSQAMASGEALLDPRGLVRDLQRNFPGMPPEGVWVRDESIAGLPSQRIESCEATTEGRRAVWRCEGEVEGPKVGPARLHLMVSSSVVVMDKHGLVSLEGTYSGTLVMLDESGTDLVDRPVAGRRLVVRR
ncbi:MAG: hypothetical protein JRJ84_07955 [Deltaproteobacteria bacterium]|nr:hypothetical protein [Deltaproteobacteria bacterium]